MGAQGRSPTTQPHDDATQPHDDATQPHDDATQPHDDATQPHDDATQPHDDAIIREAGAQLDAYFAGSLTDFDLPLALAGTEFEQRVWALLREIGYGETVSYGEIARWVGSPGSARAVGVANARNAVAIIVPCHRVIGADGSMTGYGGGLSRKVWLLEHEASHREARGSRRGASPSGQLALGISSERAAG